jgi:small glutamine-rich tetratricopeptide repeat-containing protein alpha
VWAHQPSFKVDPTDEAAVKDAVGGQSLVGIYSVYEKLRNNLQAGAQEINDGQGQALVAFCWSLQ